MTKTYKNPSINKKSRSKTLKGGKVIGSGGFGCIFKPQLKCVDKPRSSKSENQITKLMKNKHATKEYNEILKFKNLLKGIPNYSHYFLLEGFSVCKPDNLTSKDLKNFDKKCSALKKIDITEANINSSLDQLTALNMPYGGIDVGKFIDEYWHHSEKMIELNNSLLKLLERGIIPMNRAGVFHADLKSSNILVKEEDRVLYTRLIDWGLSTSYSPGEKIPRVLTNRPFQYNVPFSNIIFNNIFTNMYKKFLEKNPDPDYYATRTFVINFVLEWIKKRGPGHLETINSIFKKFFEGDIKNAKETFRDELIEFDYTFYFIFEYLTQIVVKFTKNNEFDIMTYFNEVFLKNIDLWGFVMSYIPIVEDIVIDHKPYTADRQK